INSAAVRRPALITEISKEFGSQCVVVAIDTDLVNGKWKVFVDGGKTPVDLLTNKWASMAAELGAGEILLTSMQRDGTKDGFSIDITSEITSLLSIPVIASGGAGTMEHFRDVFKNTGCSAALAASIFHYGEIEIPELKKYLLKEGIAVRI
ncbi:MAG: imidazole glycerol phosphate synthase subunit HisF, partial [Bacteroidales bacterium]|nr:imidazole glycerol phosphate synthase subunit HisF [Bacteroidales bacterium]